MFHVLALINMLLVVINTALTMALFIPVALIKLLSSKFGHTRVPHQWLTFLASRWVKNNRAMLRAMTRTQLQVTGLESLTAQQQYLIICNHRSWVDIVALQSALIDDLPFITFFLKRSLIYVPLMGFAWWALDFPFMRRHSRAEIEADPSLAGKDLTTTRQFCERLRGRHTTVLTFAEGTRWTAKKAKQSPYRHLLRPKAGGLAFTLASLPEPPNALVDITLRYQPASPSLWQLLGGQVKTIHVEVKEIPIPESLKPEGYGEGGDAKAQFQEWLNQVWRDKDDWLEEKRATASD